MPTLTLYRQQSAREAGRYYSDTSNAEAMTTLTLIDTALKSSLSINDQWVDYQLYIPGAAAADKKRVVETYTPSTGTLTVDLAWSAVTVPGAAAGGVAYELHGMFDVDELHAHINDGLKRCFLVVEITITPTANATRHDITTANTWLTKLEWVRQVGWLLSNEVRAETDPYQNRRVAGFAEKIGGTVYLNHAGRSFASNETIYVKCIKPAYYHCKASAGAFGDQSGLSLETDEAVPSVEWVAAAALMQAARRELVNPNPDAKSLWRERMGDWVQIYNKYRQAEFELPGLTLVRVPRWGTRSWGR